ncbi:TetR/AcrR family transcriptional regulator [Nocardioides bruguierae]|uniref:TetR/AcrR family transcriptional regulator n=1 Tax=Nocardioides bruguierae TaxID=2945102 RepID=A0A9X2D6D9_9ACTN|nr:TetR/AcrR family transcriptional regulator [Nocardioides bruguierae]MCM0620232.1 TetR/AcrR family transcriptional regulator [Nocardioides bruguierae]
MPSLRNTADSEGDSSRQDVYLDAARACLLDLGWRRTTLTEVSRRAAVSRMTIYRTWADMPTLLGDLMTREWSRVMADVLASRPDEASPDRPVDLLVDDLLAAVRALRENELFARIVELDPELLLPYLLNRRGRSQEQMAQVVAGAVARCQEAGAARAGDPVLLARALLLTLHGHVLSRQTMVDDAVDEAALEAELAHQLRASLAPTDGA